MPLPTKRTLVATGINDYISMWYGPPGVGKTSFVDALAGSVLFISTDRGTRFLNTMRCEVNSWEDLETTFNELEEPQAPRYDIIAIDHVDDIVNMAEEDVLQELKVDSLGDKSIGWGVGWKGYKRNIFSIINRIKALNSGIVFIAHESQKKIKVNGIERDVIMPNLGKSAYNIIVPLADLIGYIGLKTVKNAETGVRENLRYFTTEPTTDIYAKDRTRRVRRHDPEYEPLDGKYFISTFAGAQESPNESSSHNGPTNRHGRRSIKQPQGSPSTSRPSGRRARR